MESLAKLGISGWDLLLYAVNFGLVVWLVARYMTKPMLKMLDLRRSTIKKNIDEAEELRTQMAKQQEDMEQQKAQMQAQLAEELTKSRKEIEAKRKSAEAEIDAKKAKMLEEVQAVISQEKAEIIQSSESHVLKLMQKVVLHIVSNQIPEEVVQSSVKTAWSKYNK